MRREDYIREMMDGCRLDDIEEVYEVKRGAVINLQRFLHAVL